MLQNEFLSDKYNADVGDGKTLGQAILQTFDMRSDPSWMWGGVGFAAGFFVFMNVVSGIVIERVRFERNIGTTRLAFSSSYSPMLGDSEKGDDRAVINVVEHEAATSAISFEESPSQSPVVPLPTATSSLPATDVLPFNRISLAWRNLRYTVNAATSAAKDRTAHDKVLIQCVTGRAAPGRLTALMGASGAGTFL